MNAESVCSSYKKTVGVVTFVDNRISQVRSPQEKIPVVLEERNGVMVPVLDVPDVSLTQERVIKAGDTIPFVSVVKNKSSLLLGRCPLILKKGSTFLEHMLFLRMLLFFTVLLLKKMHLWGTFVFLLKQLPQLKSLF